MYKKRILTLTLCVSLMLTLIYGCKNDNNDTNNDFGGIDDVIAFDPERVSEIGQRPVFDVPHREKPIEELFPELTNPVAAVPYGNGIYVSANSARGQWSGRQIVFCDLDDRSVVSPFPEMDNFSISFYTTFSDGSLLVAGSQAEFDEYGYFVWSNDELQIYKLTENDKQLLFELPFQFFGIGNCIALDEVSGRIYLLTFDVITAYSMSGEILFELKTEGYTSDIIFSKQNNSLCVLGSDEWDMTVSILDTERLTLNEVARLSGYANIFTHPKERGFITGREDSMVYSFDYQTNTFSELFEASKYGITDFVWFIHEHEGQIIMITEKVGGTRLIRLGQSADYDGPVETLRLGTLYGHVNDLVTDFNFYNPQYNIEAVSYAVPNDEYGIEAARLLNEDIISGKAPDIMLLTDPLMQEAQMPIRHYIASGALLDLAPYMARDLNPDDYWESAIKTLYSGNACYIAVPSFSAYAIIGSGSAVGGMNHNNTQELFEFMKKDLGKSSPLFAITTTRERFVTDMVLANISEFVDYRNGAANFDSDGFITLLEASRALNPIEFDLSWGIDDVISLARKNSQIAFIEAGYVRDLAKYVSALDGDYQIAGFSGEDADGVAMIPHYVFGISSYTQSAEGAWAFLRFIYENEGSQTLPGMQIPMNKTPFTVRTDEYVADWERSYSEYGPGGTILMSSGEEVFVPGVNIELMPEIAAQTRGLVESIDRLYLADNILLNIICEELPSYYAETRTARETAKVIQNRAQTYIWELG